MRSLIVAVCVACCAGVAVAGPTGERELFDKATGVAVTLPEGWAFFADHVSLRATSGDERALVVMMATEQRFEQELLRLEMTVGGRLFEDVKVDEALILLGEDRGGLEGAVAMRGTAVHRMDGQPVEFAATLVKAGDAGELIFGAWKDPHYARVVQEIVDSVHVRLPEMETGLRLTDRKTGATITIPDQWSVYAYRTGLIAFEPDRRAMTLIVRSDGDFEATRKRVRAMLTQRVFTDVQIGEFGAMAGISEQGLGRLVAANGTARHRLDGASAEFMVIVAERVDQNTGLLIVGAWKDDKHRELVARTLESLHLEK
ncbi:MAG: hypothetical protein ACYTF4_03800 [Planctomycetota bacterium]|jgi:hypothetical protein